MSRTTLLLILISCFSSILYSQVKQIDILPPLLEVDAEPEIDTVGQYLFPSNALVKTEDIPVHGNLQLLSLLQHQNPSLTIFNNSGSPGASMSANLRGRNSYYNNYSPLIVLDGMPIDNSEWNNTTGGTDQSNRLIDINPYNIASVRIINGSAGAVLYGIRGANGVLLLTSKTGSTSTPRITINSEITSSKVGKLPARQSEYAQGSTSLGESIYRGPETSEADSWGPSLASLEYDGDSSYPFDKNGRLVPKGFGNGTPANSYDPYVFFQNALSSNLNASISGSTSLLKYYISGGSNTVNGVIPKTNYTRNSISGSINSDITKKININLGARYILSNTYRNQKGSNIKGVMLGLLRNTPTFDITNGLSPSEAVNNSSAYTKADGGQRSYRNGVYDSPYWSINNNPHDNKINRLIGNAAINYKFNDDILFTATGGIDTYSDTREGGLDINPGRDPGSAYLREREYQSSNVDLRTNINKSFISNLETKFQIGVNYFDTKTKDKYSEGIGLKTNGNVILSNAEEITISPYTISTKNFGLLSSIDLTYNDALNVNLSARQDYSSTSGSNQQGFLSYGIYSSFDLFKSFKSEEQSLNPPKLIAFAGYGRSGQSAPASSTLSSFIPTVIGGDGFISQYELNSTLERSDIGGNPELKAEKTDAFEVGFSMSELSNRINFSATFYDEKTSDVVLLRAITPSSGFTAIFDNVATIRNKGFELSLTAIPIESDNFTWIVQANLAKNKNTVEEIDLVNKTGNFLSGFANSTSSSFEEGQPYGAIRGSGFLTDDVGRTIIGIDGFPFVDPNQKTIGDPNPNFTIGLDNQFTIGQNFKIGILLDIKQGGDMWCFTCGSMNYFGVSQLSADERSQTMIFDGVTILGGTNTQVVELAGPTLSENEFFRRRYGFGGIGEMNVFDASWIRIRRLDLSYNFSSLVAKTKFIQSFSIGIYADNLWLSTDYPGIDPETNLTGNSNGFGLDYFNNPSTRTVGVSINLTL